MNKEDLSDFNQAIKFSQAGHKEAAYEVFKKLRFINGSDSNLLLWLAFTSPFLSEAEDAIRQTRNQDPTNSMLLAADPLKPFESHKICLFKIGLRTLAHQLVGPGKVWCGVIAGNPRPGGRGRV